MSQASRSHLRLEKIGGITVVSFVDTKIVTEENIQEVGDQLYSLVEDEGHKELLLNFGNVQYLSSADRLRCALDSTDQCGKCREGLGSRQDRMIRRHPAPSL